MAGFAALVVAMLMGCTVSNAKLAAPAMGGVQRVPLVVPIPKTAVVWDKELIYGEVEWSGQLVVKKPVVVTKTGKLTIEAGARIYFDMETKGKAAPHTWVLVLGEVVVEGSAQKPVELVSVKLANSGDTDIFSVQTAKKALFSYASFQRGGWAVHVHDTDTLVSNCFFSRNYGGLRFKNDGMRIEGNRFQFNKIGIRALQSKGVKITGNSFLENETGIFFREGMTGAVIRSNDFANAEYDFKLGENQREDVQAQGNWWRAAAGDSLAGKIYDGEDSEGVGRVLTDPVLPAKINRKR